MTVRGVYLAYLYLFPNTSKVSQRTMTLVWTILTVSSLCFSRRSQASDLAVVISRMQKNADQVEKNILAAEEHLNVVRSAQKHQSWRLKTYELI